MLQELVDFMLARLRFLVEIWRYILFVYGGSVVAIVDLILMYAVEGKQWQQAARSRHTTVVQFTKDSPTHSKVNALDVQWIVHPQLRTPKFRFDGTFSQRPVAAVTGVSYGGIGFYTAVQLMLAGVRVIGVVPTLADSATAREKAKELLERHGAETVKVFDLVVVCDLSDVTDVARKANRILNIPFDFGQQNNSPSASSPTSSSSKKQAHSGVSIFVANAGIMATPPALSAQGLELQFATHHVGHSLLISRLCEYVRSVHGEEHSHNSHEGTNTPMRRTQSNVAASSPKHNRLTQRTPHHVRIVVVGSAAASSGVMNSFTTFCDHRKDQPRFRSLHNRYDAYGNAKLVNLLYAFGLSKTKAVQPLIPQHLTINVIHPGPIRSRISPNSQLPLQWVLDGDLSALLRLTPAIGATYVTDLCLNESFDQVSGKYLRMGHVFDVNPVNSRQNRKPAFYIFLPWTLLQRMWWSFEHSLWYPATPVVSRDEFLQADIVQQTETFLSMMETKQP